MKKIFLLLLIIISFFTMTTVTFAQQTLRSLDVSPKPIQPDSPQPASDRPSTPPQPNSPQPRSPEPDNFSCSRIWVYQINQGTIAHIALTDLNTPPITGFGDTSKLGGNLPANLPAQASLDGATFNPGLKILKTVPISELATELEKLGCNITSVGMVISISPIIHVYSPAGINITLPDSVTFTNHSNYSLLEGVKVSSYTPLYYELNKAKINTLGAALLNNQRSIVLKGADLQEYLTAQLIPQLALTLLEVNDFLSMDVNPQLKNISSSKNYQLFVLQNREVDSLMPLSLSPQPESISRNLIVIRSTDQSLTTDATLNIQPVSRQGITVVENGFILFD